MVANEFWLTDQQWAMLGRLIPMHRPGGDAAEQPACHRRHPARFEFGCPWRDCPAVYGPHTLILRAAVNPAVMGRFVLRRTLVGLGWATTLCTACTAVAHVFADSACSAAD